MHNYCWSHLKGDDRCVCSAIRLPGLQKNRKKLWYWSPFISSVGGVHCVNVAVQLVSKRQPGLGGEIYLGASTQASCSFAVTTPGCRGAKARLHLLDGNCRRGALPALAALFTASVERKALQHFHTHGGRGVCRERAENRDITIWSN